MGSAVCKLLFHGHSEWHLPCPQVAVVSHGGVRWGVGGGVGLSSRQKRSKSDGPQAVEVTSE